MNENTREVQLKATMDATGVRAGVEQAKTALGDLGKAAEREGAKAGAGIGQVGDGAEKASTKVDREVGRMAQSIQRATAAAEAGGRGTAAYFEAIAKQRGISSDALGPYLAQLRQAEAAQNAATAGLGNMGMSAKATAAALRQVPAQFTDIATSLAAGQAPLTVFLQQGGQLKDAFGGAGAAAKALGGYVLGLINPFTIAAAAGAVLALAYNQGANEAQAFTRALVLSGNQAGLTARSLQDMARAQSAIVGTQGEAAEALAKLAGTGRVSALAIESAAEAVVRFGRVGGSVDDTIKKFERLGKEPLKAVVDLNEAENFLTVAVYKQIKALEDQGRVTEAASLAQQTYAAALNGRAKQIEQSLGSIERGWVIVKDAAKLAWDAMLNVGRPQSTAALDQQIASLERQQQVLSQGNAAQKTQALLIGEQVAALRQQRDAVSDVEREQKKAAAAAQTRNVETDKAIKADEDAKKAAKAINSELEKQRKLVAELAGLSGDFFEEWARLPKVYKDVEQLTQAQAKLLDKQPIIRENAKAELDAAKAVADARAQARRAEEKAIVDFQSKEREETEARLKSIRDRTAALRDENAASVVARTQNISLAEAINKLTLQRLEDKAAALEQGSAAEEAVRREIQLRKELGDQQSLKELNDFLDPTRAQSFGEALSGAFAQAGNSLAKLSGSLQEYATSQRQIAANVARLGTETDPAERARKSLLLQNKAQENSIALYANMAGAAKGFFREGTKGYKALEAAETAFRLVQLASDLQKGLSAAAVGIANQAQGDPYSAFPRMAAMAAAMAALGFAVGGFGGGGSSGGGDGAPVATGTGTVLGDSSAKSESLTRALSQLADTAKLQLTTQSGMLSALRNIENNIGGLSSLVVRGGTSSANAADKFGVQQGYSLNSFNAFGKTALGILDSFTAGLFTKLMGSKTTVTGNGLFAGSQNLGNIVSGGLNLQDYIDVQTKKKFFGITYSTSNSSQYSPADPLLEQQFTKVFQSLYTGILSASGPLGLAFDQVKAQLDGFVLNIGKIDLSGLTGTQITEKLTSIIGAAADSISTAAIPGLQEFQKVGEGYFETLVRVASGVETAKDDLSRLGIVAINYADVIRKQGDVAAEIVRQSIAVFESADGTLSSVGALINNLDASADDLASTYKALVGVRDTLIAVGEGGDALTASLLQGAGGLDNLASSLSTYLGGQFFSDQERAAAALASVQAQFARIGIQTVPQTYAQFRALVDSIDTTTEAGQRLYGQVIGLAGAFQTAQDAAEKAGTTVASRLPDILKSQATERNGLMVDLLKAQGDAAGAAALKRSQDLATLTAGLSAVEAAAATAGYDYIASLRAQIDATNAAAQAATQAAAAEAQRASAVASERTNLETQLLQAQGDTAALRARELQALDPSNRALQERLYLLADERAAAEAAAQAAKDLADKLAAISTEREGIQSRIDELLGNTAAIRARELATLDESNRALQERLYALQDEQAAAQAAAQAAQELANKQAAVASERFGLEGQLMQLLGDTAGLRARELAALDPSNRALQEKIYALIDEKEAQQRAAEAAQAAAQAAEQIRAAWQSVTDSLFEEVKRIRGLMDGGGQQSLASAQAQFAITTAQARAGDQEAAKLLPGLSQTLLQLAEANAGSLLDLQRIRAQISASLEQTGAGLIARFGLTLPKFAVGTNYVPRDMAAIVHEGEAIVPRAYNPAANGGGANGVASGALLQEVAGLREDNRAQALAIVKLQTEIARLLKTWDGSGLPETRVTA